LLFVTIGVSRRCDATPRIMQLASYLSNLRTLRHVIEMRTAEGAEEELRIVFDEVARVMMREAPLIFQDFERDAGGCWEPRFHKV
jgi:thymidylate synthase (FAD)